MHLKIYDCYVDDVSSDSLEPDFLDDDPAADSELHLEDINW